VLKQDGMAAAAAAAALAGAKSSGIAKQIIRSVRVN
jgi:hypothetical protein